MKLNTQQIEAYGAEGYCFVPGLLPMEMMAPLMPAAESLFDVDRPEVIREKDGVTVRSLMNVHTFCPLIDQLVRHPSLIEPVEQILGSQVYIFQCILNLKRAFTGEVWQWHQDLPTYLMDDGVPGDRLVNVLIFLEEVTEFNGPLMIIPGSHRDAPHRRDVDSSTTSFPLRTLDTETVGSLAKAGGIVAPKGPPGSVIFAHTNFVHGSGPNLSPYGRAVISLTLNALDNKHSRSQREDWIVMDDYEPVVPRS